MPPDTGSNKARCRLHFSCAAQTASSEHGISHWRRSCALAQPLQIELSFTEAVHQFDPSTVYPLQEIKVLHMTRIKAAANLSGFVRNLGAFEEIYWPFNQSGSQAFAFAMEVEGSTTAADWRPALDALQQSQPLSSVRIEPNTGGVPFFHSTF